MSSAVATAASGDIVQDSLLAAVEQRFGGDRSGSSTANGTIDLLY